MRGRLAAALLPLWMKAITTPLRLLKIMPLQLWVGQHKSVGENRQNGEAHEVHDGSRKPRDNRHNCTMCAAGDGPAGICFCRMHACNSACMHAGIRQMKQRREPARSRSNLQKPRQCRHRCWALHSRRPPRRPQALAGAAQCRRKAAVLRGPRPSTPCTATAVRADPAEW